MRRITVTMKIASLVLAASLFTGCSVANTANDTPGASGGAVSGSVAAEDGEEVLAAKSKNHLENSDNRYESYYDEKTDYIAQYRLDGTLVKKNKIKNDGVAWVTDEWLYYIREDYKTEIDTLWRIPIKKTDKGDRLLTDKKEKVLDAYLVDVDYVTDSYIIMEIYDYVGGEERDLVCKYDLETGKRTELIGAEEDEEAEVLWGNTYPLMWEGNLFFEGFDKLYILDPEKGRVSSLYSFKKSEYIDDYALIGNELYFLANNKLYQCNCSTKETECVISEKKFKKAIQDLDLNLGNIKSIEMEDVYLNQGRLYFDIGAELTKKKSGSGKKDVYYKYELFSVSLDDLGKFQHEDKLMDYLDKKGEFSKSSYTSYEYWYHTGYVRGIVDGKIIASYYKVKGEGDYDYKYRYVIYDLQTGEIEDIAEKELPEEYKDY